MRGAASRRDARLRLGCSPASPGRGSAAPRYAHCIDGQSDAANQRITDALSISDTQAGPNDEEDDDREKTP